MMFVVIFNLVGLTWLINDGVVFDVVLYFSFDSFFVYVLVGVWGD